MLAAARVRIAGVSPLVTSNRPLFLAVIDLSSFGKLGQLLIGYGKVMDFELEQSMFSVICQCHRG